jgi:hypothetical protein
MIGFVTSPQVAQAILDGVASAQTSRGLPVYWTPGAFPIHSGKHTGKTFIPFDEDMMATVLHQGMTPMDFPETPQLLAVLGGLEARIDLTPEAIQPTEQFP